VLFVKRKKLQVGFQTFFDHFCLVVRLWVIGGAHVSLGSVQFKKRFTKYAGEIWITIRHNRGGHAMQLENVIKEKMLLGT
jgi:hypothetical protein